MPTPLDVPKRPAWRYQPVRMAGTVTIPAQGVTDLNRNTATKRTAKNDRLSSN